MVSRDVAEATFVEVSQRGGRQKVVLFADGSWVVVEPDEAPFLET